MGILSHTFKIPLDERWTLYVTYKGPNAKVILAVGDDKGAVKERITAHLTPHQALQLARALAGISAGKAKRNALDWDGEDTDEDGGEISKGTGNRDR